MYRPAGPPLIDLDWENKKKVLLLQFTKLTENDLNYESGRKYEMIKKISLKLGKTEEEIRIIFQTK